MTLYTLEMLSWHLGESGKILWEIMSGELSWVGVRIPVQD